MKFLPSGGLAEDGSEVFSLTEVSRHWFENILEVPFRILKRGFGSQISCFVVYLGLRGVGVASLVGEGTELKIKLTIVN